MDLASRVDHTLLRPDASRAAVEQLCSEALAFRFAAVCVNPCHVPMVAARLRGSGVKTCTVIGFPLGAATTAAKAFEAADAIRHGADEIDMVINVGALLEGDAETVTRDIRAVVEAARGKAQVKVILETCLLDDESKRLACRCCMEAGADFVKTSTGFSTGGATVEDVALLRATVGDRLKVKASGGIRTRETAEAMVRAGADRLGTSSGTAFAEPQEGQGRC